MLDIDDILYKDFWQYAEAMDRIEAQKILVELNVGDYSTRMNKDDRRKFHKSLYDEAYPPTAKDFKSTEELTRFLNG